MKILTAEQIHKWDEYTIQHEPVSSLEFMERAALQCTQWLIRNKLQERTIKLFCGKGNNGGDGLAIARQLIQKGIHPIVYVVEFSQRGSTDFEANLYKLSQLTKDIYFIESKATFPAIGQSEVVVDALLGSGISRPAEGLAASLIDHLNSSGASVISIDIPSGMFPDTSSKGKHIIKAHHTLTFQCLKLCLIMAENSDFFGEVEILEIGLHQEFLSSAETNLCLTTFEDAAKLYQPRKQFAHKGNFGHALIIGGAEGKTGAAIIATEACLRSGAGLTSVHLLSDSYIAINARCPEAMTLAGDELVKKNLGRFSAIGIGPGSGTDDIAQHIISLLLENYEGRLLLDADALNVISQNKALLNQLPSSSIITPHPKEFDRLFGDHENEFARMETALHQSKERNCIIILKGHHTLVAVNGEGFFNTTGNTGLAKGGSGDALTGIITSLLAQHYTASSAAKLGVFIHGLTADLAAQHQSYESILATDLNNYIGSAFKKLSNVSY